ncbi:MAG: thiamine phosphate synthase, partial [Blastocatellia bacterium]|nr:thiamine phosphate synthase [Blastocatellia bacterium]
KPHSLIVEAIVKGGCRLVQLRDKSLSSKELLEQAKESLLKTREFGALLIINDRVDIAKMSGADGVHLGQSDLSPEKARKLLGSNAIIGLSTHSLEQALVADNLPIDYIAVGPVYKTVTKPEASAGVESGSVGLELLREVKKRVTKPVVAIGGITLERVSELAVTEVSSVAVISDLLSKGNITERTSQYVTKLESLSKLRRV